MSAKCSTREIGYPSSTGLGRRASRLRLMMRCVSTKGNNKSVCQSAAAWWQVFFSSSSLSSLSFESQEESGSVMQTTIDLVSPLIGSLTTLVLYVVGPSGTCHHGDNRQRQHLHISPTHHHPPSVSYLHLALRSLYTTPHPSPGEFPSTTTLRCVCVDY